MANNKNFVVKNGLEVGQDITANNVTANIVTADLSGNADSASTLETPRTISLGGDLSGSASFDGSSDITISATVTNTYDGWDLLTDGTSRGRITSGENVNIVGGTNVTLGYSTTNNTITINAAGTPPNDATITLSAGSGLSGGGNFTTDQASNETITFNHADTSSQGSVDNSGGTVIQDVTLDTYGHVTALGSKSLTASDVGALSSSGKAADSNLLDGLNSSQFLRADANDTLTSVMKVSSSGNLIYEKDTNQGFIPLLAQARGGSTVTGAIKVAFPVHGTADMIMGFVDIFDYASNESVTLFVAGYLYQTTGNNEWVNETVSIIAGSTSKDYTVRFGADGSSNCFWIGETTSTWGHPQVTLRDWSVGYTSDVDAYATGTTISFVTSFDTVDSTISGNLPVASYANNSNLLDGIDSSQFLRSDTSDVIDAGTNTTLTIRSNDGGASTIQLYGDNQGTGRVYVGQNASYGGGIEYNGDGSPSTTGAGSDYITLWRRSVGIDEWTARNGYNSNNWEFRGNIYANTNQRVFADNYHPNADKLTTARTISLGGDLSGSASFDGSSNITIAATVSGIFSGVLYGSYFRSDYATTTNSGGVDAAMEIISRASNVNDWPLMGFDIAFYSQAGGDVTFTRVQIRKKYRTY